MKYQRQRLFIQEDFPHIRLEDAVHMPSGNLFPLCDLKLSGNCQDITIITPKVPKEGDPLYWETAPRIKSCAECNFHKRNCYAGNCERH